MRTRIKICCIASPAEAEAAVAAGADALGLVARMPPGPGPIEEEAIARIAALVPPPVATFLLTSETSAEAEDKMAAIDKLPLEVDALLLLSEALNFDFSTKGMDEPFTDEEMKSISGLQTIRDRVVQVSGNKNPTVREFVKFSQRGRPRNPIVGGPKEVADELERWFVERACDGFVLAATHVPGTYEDFVWHVVPELQRRGLYHKDYAGATLRENLGLPKAAVGDWREVEAAE